MSVEHEAKQRKLVRTPAHLELRQTRGREAMQAFLAWLEDHKDTVPPKSALGQAISYARKWEIRGSPQCIPKSMKRSIPPGACPRDL